MSQPSVLGQTAAGAAVAATGSLPVTGGPVWTLVIVGFGLVAGGVLMLRAVRYRRATH